MLSWFIRHPDNTINPSQIQFYRETVILVYQDTLQQAQVEKQEGGECLPRPLDYTDLNSGELNSQATPGGMAQVTGYRLKFDPTDTSQGIFFVNGSATRVSIVGKNNPSELMFLVPASLAPGD